MKPKLLIWSDFVAPTGFGNVAKNLFDKMHERFDVSVVAINYYGNSRYDSSKYFVYSAAKDDLFNKRTLFKVIKEEKPELIILFQDSFNIAEILPTIKKLSPTSKIISYFPVDASDFSPAWHGVLFLSDAVITYTDWAVSIIKNAVPGYVKEIFKLYHGVDQDVFKPIPEEHIDILRKEAGWEDKFVICNVNRFQPRKAVPLSVRAFSMFALGYKICKCGNWYPIHRTTCDMNGCSATDVTEVVDNAKSDVYYYLHMNASEPGMGSSRTDSLQHHLIMSGFKDTHYNKLIGINSRDLYVDPVAETVINDIYNCSNINLTTTNGEGFGLSLIEAAATGTRSIAPNNSAIPEVLKGTGRLVNNVAVFSHQLDNAFMRPVVDVRGIVTVLEEEYAVWNKNGKKKLLDFDCLSLVKEHYDWNKIREQLNKIINEL